MTARGFTLIEAVVSIAVLGVMLAAVMNTVGASSGTRLMAQRQLQAAGLADELLAEILPLPYADPDTGVGLLLEIGEDLSGDRSDFDDVDDYHNWSAAPPQTRDGRTIPGADAFRRTVEVHWGQLADLDQPAGSESGIKRITVIVSLGGKVIGKAVGLRTLARPDAAEAVE
jgi:prepilin-type N-terminal cleavage/methylation domain-containing protein